MNKQQEPRLRFKGFTGEWQETTIGELGEIITGNTPATSESDNYENNGLLWITPTDIKESITIKTAKQLSEKGKKSARCLPPNSILITCIASIGKNTLIETYGSCNQQINALIPKKECNPYFLLTLSELWSIQMKKIAGSGTMDIVNKTQFSEIKTKLPSSEEQTAIGNFFRRLDSQIAESRAVLEKSRQLKKAMLAKMFPANGEKIPKIRFKGFEGEWECRKLGEVSIIKTGISNREDSDLFGEYTFFDRSQDVRKSNTYLYDCEAIIMAGEGSEFFPKHFVGKFDLHQRSYAIMNFLECDGLFVFYYLHLMNDYFCNQAVGSTVKSLRLPMFTEMPILLPTKFEQIQIGKFFRQLDETIALQAAEVEKLNQLKKGLLAAMLV
ncbi:restriction endonuclease subunit S [Neisseria elongata]|uniref:restriction endonuclease subunit S n=1 Tax=Neisseria elongata TaxID=495 RepID=UPI000D30E4D7|nr:restriction endonuclease subunit S [Neisseria elongata]